MIDLRRLVGPAFPSLNSSFEEEEQEVLWEEPVLVTVDMTAFDDDDELLDIGFMLPHSGHRGHHEQQDETFDFGIEPFPQVLLQRPAAVDIPAIPDFIDADDGSDEDEDRTWSDLPNIDDHLEALSSTNAN
jgi:hypothetical protein